MDYPHFIFYLVSLKYNSIIFAKQGEKQVLSRRQNAKFTAKNQASGGLYVTCFQENSQLGGKNASTQGRRHHAKLR